MNVVFSDEAEHDLEQIADYIAKDNPRRALSFIIELRGKCESLSETAASFPLMPRYERYGIRRRIHGNYLVFYRVTADQVQIIHIMHGARDYAALLFEE